MRTALALSTLLSWDGFHFPSAKRPILWWKKFSDDSRIIFISGQRERFDEHVWTCKMGSAQTFTPFRSGGLDPEWPVTWAFMKNKLQVTLYCWRVECAPLASIYLTHE
jgi:hypothetical protein